MIGDYERRFAMRKEKDHIWPKAEGGPNEKWNIREIDRLENRRKGAEMPSVDNVLDSSDPARLAAEIDRRSLKGFKHSRNRDRGFGGLPRYR